MVWSKICHYIAYFYPGIPKLKKEHVLRAMFYLSGDSFKNVKQINSQSDLTRCRVLRARHT